MILRSISFLIALLTALFMPFWVFIGVAFIYGLIFIPYELLVIALMVDAQFGGTDWKSGYLYIISTAIVCGGLHFLKPYLRFYK